MESRNAVILQKKKLILSQLRMLVVPLQRLIALTTLQIELHAMQKKPVVTPFQVQLFLQRVVLNGDAVVHVHEEKYVGQAQ